MEKFENINQVFDLLDRYVRLNFLVRILTSQSSKNAEEFNSTVFDIDFAKLGLSDAAVDFLGETPNVNQLKVYQQEISNLATEASSLVFGYLPALSNEFKIAAKEHVDSMVSHYLTKAGSCQDSYLELVMEIDRASQEGDYQKIRNLGKLAKASFNKLYEYNTISQNYANVGSYLNGMTRMSGRNK